MRIMPIVLLFPMYVDLFHGKHEYVRADRLERMIRRAAMLTAAAIAVLLKRSQYQMNVGMEKICIGIDGSLYRFHPRFNMVIQRHLKILAPILLNYELRISADGKQFDFVSFIVC
jgi:hexokinase